MPPSRAPPRAHPDRALGGRSYAFRDSIEAATCALHDKIKTGDIVISDGKFPQLAHELFRQHGPAESLFKGVEGDKTSSGTGLVDWQGQLTQPRRKPGTKPRLSAWQRECTEEECVLCGVRRLAPGSSTWAGSGIYSYLNEEPYLHADPPVVGTGVGVFGCVPRPPDRWMPERFAGGGNGPRAFLSLINTRAEKDAALEKIAEHDRKQRSLERAAGGGEGGGAGGSGDPISLDDESLADGGAAGAGGGDNGGDAGGEEAEGASGVWTVMLSDDGDDYKDSGGEDCSEGDTDELASDDDANQLYNLARTWPDGQREQGSFYLPAGVFVATKTSLYGKSREAASKVLLAPMPYQYQPRLPRGSRCPPPAPADGDADDEAEDEVAGASVRGDGDGGEEAGGELDEEERLYEDFFNEALDEAGRDEEMADELDVGGDAAEFYGGAAATRAINEAERRRVGPYACRYSGDESYGGSYDSYEGEGYGEDDYDDYW